GRRSGSVPNGYLSSSGGADALVRRRAALPRGKRTRASASPASHSNEHKNSQAADATRANRLPVSLSHTTRCRFSKKERLYIQQYRQRPSGVRSARREKSDGHSNGNLPASKV